MRSALARFTARGASFLAAGIIGVLAGLGLGSDALVSVGVMLVCLPLFSVWTARRARYQLRCERRIVPPRAAPGQRVTVQVCLENVSRIATGLLLAEEAIPYSLGPRPRYVLNGIERGGAREISYPLRSDLRGKYQVGPLRIQIADVFGLVSFHADFATRATLTVTPKVVPLTGAPATGSWSAEGDGRSRMTAAAGDDDVIPRAYRDGDELRRVHWRSTARYGELMVRREEQRWQDRAVLILDTRRLAHAGSGPASSFEYAVSAAASIGVHAARSGLAGHLLTDSGPLAGPAMFEDVLLDALSVVTLSRNVDFARATTALSTIEGGLLVLIAGRLSADAARELAAARRQGCQGIALLLAVSTWAAVPGADRTGTDPAAAGRPGAAAGSGGPAARPASAAGGERGSAGTGNPAGTGTPAGPTAPAAGEGAGTGMTRFRRHDETAAAQAILQAAGWRVITADSATPLQPAWQHRPALRRGPPGGGPVNHKMTAVAAAAVILASFSEFSLARGVAWFAAAAGAVIVVALAGTLTRLPRLQAGTGATLLALAGAAPLVAARPVAVKMGALPLLACCAASIRWPRHFRVVADLATYLSALLIYLTVVFARAQAFALFVPTTGVIRQLGALARAGAALTAYAPPVPGTPGVALLAAGGIGLAAVVVDIIAVRLRRPALTGLPLLAVYIAPIASAAKVGGLGGLVAFALAASGYLALLSAEGRDRLRGWGALVTVWHQVGEDDRLGGADVAPLAATGRRIGLAAVCAAALAPLILPSLHLPRLLNGAGGGGIQPVAVGLPDPVVQLHSQLSREKPEPVLTYRARGAGQDDYLQIYVLNYDPSRGSWVLIRPDAGSQVGAGPMQPPPGLAPGTPVLSRTLTVTLGPVGRGYSWPIFFLPVPYWPQRLQVAGSWREANGTLMVYSGTTDPAGLRYTVTSGQPVVTGAELAADASLPVPPAIARDYLGFRSPLAGLLRGIADRVTRGQSSAFGRAVALERWFQSARFGYSLRSDLPDTAQGLLTFLTT